MIQDNRGVNISFPVCRIFLPIFAECPPIDRSGHGRKKRCRACPDYSLFLSYAFLAISGVEALPADALAIPGGRRWFDSTSTPLPSGITERVIFRLLRTTVIAMSLAVTMAILYALAAGPLVYMERIGRPVLSVEAFLWTYEPLNRAEAKIKPVGLTMQFYIDFWERAAKRHLATQAEKAAQSKE